MPLRNLLDAACQGLAVLTRAEVRSLGQVESDSGQPSSIVVAYDREERERMFEVDAVVLATSAKAAARLGAKLLTTAEREMLASVRYAPTVTLALALCRPASWHAQEIRVPHGEGNPIESVLLEPGQVGGRIPDGLGAATLRANHAYAARAMDLPEETIEKDLLGALDRVAPAVRGAIDFARLYRVERALPRFDVGQYRAIARLTRVEADRRRTGSRLYTAGDYRMDPSWIGAFLAGRQAAGRVAADLRARSTP
jgi:protoporphyrinogen oxidase